MVTLSDRFELVEEVRKSRFVCRAGPVGSEAAAMAFLEAVRERKASHNCWAFRVGEVARSSDDGEPGGTAGRPVLGAIDKGGFDRVMVVVTRYFGGIKLGAGGLARAYGGIAARCLQSAPTVTIVVRVARRVRLSFEQLGPVRGLLERHGAAVTGEAYDPTGGTLTVELPAAAADTLAAALREATAGSADLLPPDQ